MVKFKNLKGLIVHEIKIFASLFIFFFLIFYIIAYLNFLRIQKYQESKLPSKEEYLIVNVNNIFNDHDTLLKRDRLDENKKKLFILRSLLNEIKTQIAFNNLVYKTNCALGDGINFEFRVNIICYDNLSYSQETVMESFRKKKIIIDKYSELENFVSLDKNLLNIKKVTIENKKIENKASLTQHISTIYSDVYNFLNLIFLSLIAAATIFFIVKKRL